MEIHIYEIGQHLHDMLLYNLNMYMILDKGTKFILLFGRRLLFYMMIIAVSVLIYLILKCIHGKSTLIPVMTCCQATNNHLDPNT